MKQSKINGLVFFSVFYEKDFLVQLSKSGYTYRGLELKLIGKNSVVSPIEITIVEETKRSLVTKNDEYYIKCGFLIP